MSPQRCNNCWSNLFSIMLALPGQARGKHVHIITTKTGGLLGFPKSMPTVTLESCLRRGLLPSDSVSNMSEANGNLLFFEGKRQV
jgi:hypothetical protein